MQNDEEILSGYRTNGSFGDLELLLGCGTNGSLVD